ncbi:MAG TPA: GNAT family N-acetyltransferase [Thermoplasmata archaeon]|nr:GNAT family N-acetyltransferase [Thermoplasmata archaeon]
MAAPTERAVRDFVFRPIQKPEEFRHIEEVERAAWGLRDEAPVPGSIQRAMQDNGGLVLGAFADIHLAGFAMGFLGWDGETLYHYSHRTAVRPEYQNHRLGFRLKCYQRDEVLRQGLALVRWVFDPLQSRTAFLHVRRLGAEVDRYHVHYYGQVDSDADRGMESDRVGVAWRVSTPRVEERLTGRLPSAEEDVRRWEKSVAIVETEPGETGLRVPSTVAEPTAPLAHLEIPFDLAALQEHDPAAARTWRHAVRDAFRAALDARYAVEDFAVLSRDHERRSFYFLAQRPPAPSA